MSDTDTARLYSHYLARHLDNGNLKPEILNPLLERPLTEADFTAFADWQGLLESENEEELARQLRLLRRYVMAHIITRDICRKSDLAEVTGTITRQPILPSTPRWILLITIIKACTARPSAAIPASRSI